MYHRINNADVFRSFAGYISQNHPVVIPGDTLPPGKLSICLTFDDAYFDFYHFVFPLLKKENLKAVVGVPVKYILEKTFIGKDIRLNVPYDEAMTDHASIKKAPFCTWQEIREMAGSGFVTIASHSYSHANLIQDGVDLEEEIIESKKIIEHNISLEINTFIYPYGKVNGKTHSIASKHYKYLMRIGSALNRDWHNSNNMLYRLNGDELINGKGIGKFHLFKYFLKYISNTIRGK
jgi:peptidoglycan/xylan/chitin deacetylase (PgdA/CDA1 family)